MGWYVLEVCAKNHLLAATAQPVRSTSAPTALSAVSTTSVIMGLVGCLFEWILAYVLEVTQ